MKNNQEKLLSTDVMLNGMVIGSHCHDANVRSIEIGPDRQRSIEYSSSNSLDVKLVMNGVYAEKFNINSDDMITEIFYWTKQNLLELHDGVWSEIIATLEGPTCKEGILNLLKNDNGLLHIYCATEGSASVILETFVFSIKEASRPDGA